MIFSSRSLLCALLLGATLAFAADDLPKTLMTTRGKPLASEDFAAPLAPFTGAPVGFASGFQGWRFNTGVKGGKWDIIDGTFRGAESPEAHHPATASFGIDYTNAVIQCDVRLDNVPAEGRQYRSLFIKGTDAKDYVWAMFVSEAGLNAVPYDPSRINPTTKQRDKSPAAHAAVPIKLDEWQTLVIEILGDEIVGTIDGKSVTFSSPLVGAPKRSVMLGAATQASFRRFRMWEASPNPDWPKNREALPASAKPPAK